MTDHNPSPDDRPIDALANHTLAPDPELVPRVRRSINRRVMAADALNLSFKVMALTVWDYMKALLELVPTGTDKEPEDG